MCSAASQKTANQQKKYPFFSEVPEHAQKHMGCRCYQDDPTIHYLYLFLTISVPFQKYAIEWRMQPRCTETPKIVTSTILVKKIKNL